MTLPDPAKFLPIPPGFLRTRAGYLIPSDQYLLAVPLDDPNNHILKCAIEGKGRFYSIPFRQGGLIMTIVSLYDQNGHFIDKVKVYRNSPDIILYEDRFFIFNDNHKQYREGFLIIADHLKEGEGQCNISDVGRKDKCLRCAADIDPASGIRYCAEHQIGICAEHNRVNCSTCGYNRRRG